MSQKYNELVDQHEELRKDFNGVVQKLNEAENEHAALENELAQLRGDLAALQKRFDEQAKDLEGKNKQLADALAELDTLRKNAGSKSALEDYKKEVSAKLLELLLKLAATKHRFFDVMDELLDTTNSNYKAEEAKIRGYAPDQYMGAAGALIGDIDSTLPELNQELERITQALNNLKNEKTKLLLKMQETESKLSDMVARHDDKTKMVGKLVVKLIVLTTEIERLQGGPAQK